MALLLLPKIRPSRPTTISVNFRKLFTILWQGALSRPKLNTYTDTTKPPCSYLHWNICKEMNIDINEKWSEHEPETVTRQHHNLVANANTNRYWDKGQRPDIVIKNKHETSCVFIDISISTERNTSVKVTERLSKYKDLEIKVERIWGIKAITIPGVIGVMVLIKKGLGKYVQQIPGNIKMHELQKITLLGTSHIPRKALSIK